MGQGQTMCSPTLHAVQRRVDSSQARLTSPASQPHPTATETPLPNPPDLAAAYDRLGGSLYRFFYVRVGRDEHLAADLMQGLWAAAARNAGKVPEREIEFWLRGVARNLLNTHWRRVSARPAHVAVDDGKLGAALANRIGRERLPLAELEKREVQDRLLRAITSLPAADQDLVFAHYFEGIAQVDLAVRVGMSARAIEGRLYRARQMLREALREVE
jgi:RNA polymerase sigma factor (sigma-70 family)